eukprot:gnl/Trimastix_PCT/1584.p1 GENE.gnl/Trimastix_PCT/1584~~gnl/Trimastix_PCT/1584.p1  ORF type:complete len:415 (+),score=70.07 gnl/Trimastix_PCT/1584:100-1344(+)
MERLPGSSCSQSSDDSQTSKRTACCHAKKGSSSQPFSASFFGKKGRAISCGCAVKGQLGSEFYQIAFTPRVGEHHFVALEGGYDHTVGVTAMCQVVCFGANDQGQLGLGTTDLNAHPAPSQLELPCSHTSILQVACGHKFSVLLVRLLREGCNAVFAWGANTNAQLGIGRTGTCSSLPVRVPLPADAQVVQVSCGYRHVLVRTDEGRVLAWGMNNYGQLGFSTAAAEFQSTPQFVQLPAGERAAQVAAGSAHSLVLTESGRVYACGYNHHGMVGDGTTQNRDTFVELGLPPCRCVAAGHQSLALARNGHLYAWGSNINGNLGTGQAYPEGQCLRPAPVRADSILGEVVHIVASRNNDFALALTDRGEVYAWGSNQCGCLGLGNQESRALTPTRVPLDVAVDRLAECFCHWHALA